MPAPPPDPSTIIATVPRWIGRAPRTGETVLVGLTPADDEQLALVTLEPEREPLDEVEAMRRLVVDGAEQVAVVSYTGAETEQHEATLRFLAAAASRYGLDVLGVLVVVPDQRGRRGYWRGLPVPTRFRLPLPPRPAPTPPEENP